MENHEWGVNLGNRFYLGMKYKAQLRLDRY